MKKQTSIRTRWILARLKWGASVFFVDAKHTWQRVVAVFSALFWTWLEFSFLKFLFIFIIGIASHASGSPIPYTWDLMLENREFVNLFVRLFFILVFVTRIPVHYKRTIREPRGKRNG